MIEGKGFVDRCTQSLVVLMMVGQGRGGSRFT